MISIAISVLWFLVGLIVLCAIIWLAIYIIESFVTAIPEMVKKAVWTIVLLLALIALLGMLAGGGGGIRFPSIRGDISSGPLAAVSTSTSADLLAMLTR